MILPSMILSARARRRTSPIRNDRIIEGRIILFGWSGLANRLAGQISLSNPFGYPLSFYLSNLSANSRRSASARSVQALEPACQNDDSVPHDSVSLGTPTKRPNAGRQNH